MWHFSKNWKDVPVVNHPSYRKYAPYVWTDAPDSVSSSWVCLPDWRTLWIQFVFDTVSWTVSRDFLFLNLLNTVKLFSWTMFSNSFVILPSFFSELSDYSISVLNCGHQSWTSYFTSRSVFPQSGIAFTLLAEHLTQMHVQLKTPWFPPVLFRFVSIVNRVVSVCWSLCWLVVLVPKAIQSPLYCRLCLLII